jgi:hypothetical protein
MLYLDDQFLMAELVEESHKVLAVKRGICLKLIVQRLDYLAHLSRFLESPPDIAADPVHSETTTPVEAKQNRIGMTLRGNDIVIANNPILKVQFTGSHSATHFGNRIALKIR